MSKKIKWILGLLLISLIVITFIWKMVNKPVHDYSTQEPQKEFSFNDIMNKVSNDTASLIELKDKLVAIKGKVKKVNIDAESVTVELGDTMSLSSIICQIDKRFTNDFKNLKLDSEIYIQGIITGYTIDTELNLGNTVEMNFCTLKK